MTHDEALRFAKALNEEALEHSRKANESATGNVAVFTARLTAAYMLGSLTRSLIAATKEKLDSEMSVQ